LALESVVREVLEGEPCRLNIGQEKQIILTTYADDIAVIAKSEDDLKSTTEKLMVTENKIGLVFNEN